jgi:hypothetical protein
MDVHDHSINLVEYLNGPMKELKEFFKPEFAKGLTTGGQTLFIDNFSQGAIGKFIGLYGLEDLFESLPETLEQLQIINKDNNNIIISIPPSITRFKDLNFILFDNCVDNAPDYLCELKKLRFLALMNNPKLKKIPDCVNDLPELMFLNLKGSTNVKIPQPILDRAFDLGDNMYNLSGV